MFVRRIPPASPTSALPQWLAKLPVFPLLALGVLLGFSVASHAATFTVNTTTDTTDGVCDVAIGGCSLRDAVKSATANGAEADTVVFNIPQSDSDFNSTTGVYTLALPNGTLPDLPVNTTIDGTTQTGISDTNTLGPEIELTVGTSYSGTAFYMGTGNCTVKGMIISGCYKAFFINSDNNTIQGCYIGTDRTGSNPPAYSIGEDAIYFNSGSGNTIGGITPGTGNVIAYSGGDGIDGGYNFARNNSFRGNSIFSNRSQGIDLQSFDLGSGQTPNDLGDADTGFNNNQNFPAITSVATSGGTTLVSLSLNSEASKTYGIDVFRTGSAYIDADGFGEGRVYVGSTTLVTDAGGNGTASLNVTGTFPSDSFTATATDPSGNTSEFSYAIKNSGGNVVTNTRDVGAGSLRGALQYATAYPNTTISFNIPNTDPGFDGTTYNIRLTSDLPNVPKNTTIDGTTQPGNSNPNGPEIQLLNASYGLVLTGGNSTIKSLLLNSISSSVMLKSSSNTVQGCYIGTDPTGMNYYGSSTSTGIYIEGSNNIIGGTGIGQGNRIGHCSAHGVYVSSGTGNSIRGNSIFNNKDSGIYFLGIYSYVMTRPVITSVTSSGGNTLVNVSLNSQANKTYAIDVYRSPIGEADPTGYGEGRSFAGSVNLSTGSSGSGVATLIINGSTGTDFITATATDEIGSTSDFSFGSTLGAGLPTVVVNTANSGFGSLRNAMTFVLRNPGNTIRFNIPTIDSGYNPATGVWTISPTESLPPLAGSTIIDGSSQPGNSNPLGPEIELNSSLLATPGNLPIGLRFYQDNSAIKSLIINGCYEALYITASNSRVESCYIGTDHTGTAPSPNNTYFANAIYMSGGSNSNIASAGNNNVIGGDTPAKGNIIGFASNEGLHIYRNPNCTIRNNVIMNNGWDGILLSSDSDGTTIRDNTIRNNRWSGIHTYEAGMELHQTIRFNSIYDNDVLGIDLRGDGVTPNDAGDANSLSLNYPVLTSATSSNGAVTVNGTYNSRPAFTVELDFYSNIAVDSSGYGEGRNFLGTAVVTTDEYGEATFSKSFTGVNGSFISATATLVDNPDNFNDNYYIGATSEFGNNVALPSGIFLDANSYTINESGTNAIVKVVRAGSVSGPTSIDYVIGGGTATVGTDYTATSGTLTWANGDGLDKTLNIPIKSDTVDELDETFNITLSNPTGANPLIMPNGAVVTITDDDTAGISARDVAIVEGNDGTKTLAFSALLSNASDRTISVKYATANGTATAGLDYLSASGTLTFLRGQTSKALAITIKGDTITEAAETFFFNLSESTNATITDEQAIGTITDDDVLPVLSINNVAISEGNTGAKALAFTVKLNTASAKAVSFYARTTPSASTENTEPATASTDFVALAQTLYTFNAGETSKTLNVTINGDTMDEANETFNLVLSSPTGATLGTATGIGTINDDDVTPTVAVNDVSLTEGNTGTQNAAFTVALSAPSGRTVKVTAATLDVTAAAGPDYTALPATVLTFLLGQTSKVVNVVVKGDTLSEATETFQLKLTTPVNTVITDPTGVGTIVDNDLTPSISATVSSVVEGNSGNVALPFTIKLSNPSSRDITLKVLTVNAAADSATSGVDYVAVPVTTVTIPAGATQQIFNVQIKGDEADEVNEKVALSLSVPTNATIATPKVEGIVVDDDNMPSLAVSLLPATGGYFEEGNTGAKNVNFTVSLSKPSGKTVTVNFQTNSAALGGKTAATAGTDYVAVPATKLTFAPGETSKTIPVSIKGDTLYEGHETFSGDLSGSSNASIAVASAGAYISNDDSPPSLLYYASSVVEGNSGTKTVILNLNLSAAAGTPFTFSYNTTNETALAGEDYVAQSGTITFAAGQTTRTLAIVIKGDTTFEANERFFVDFFDPLLQGVSYPITIVNDDNSTARSGGSS